MWIFANGSCVISREFRARCRAFVDKELIPYVHEWDEAGTYVSSVLLIFFIILYSFVFCSLLIAAG